MAQRRTLEWLRVMLGSSTLQSSNRISRMGEMVGRLCVELSRMSSSDDVMTETSTVGISRHCWNVYDLDLIDRATRGKCVARRLL